MKNLISTLLIIFALSVISYAQNSNVCPKIEIVGPSSTLQPGDVMTFSLSLDENAKKLNLKYFWKIDKGNIISGQGTNNIIISTDGLSDETISANVEISGLSRDCNSILYEKGVVGSYISCGGLSDHFGKLSIDDVRARIDAFFIELQNNPDVNGYIVSYGQSKDVATREKIIRDHIEFHKYDGSRITILYKGENENEKEIRTLLILLPVGTNMSESL